MRRAKGCLYTHTQHPPVPHTHTSMHTYTHACRHTRKHACTWQLLRTLLREDADAAGGGDNQRNATPLPDLDFVVNFGDAPMAIPLPDDRHRPFAGSGGGTAGAAGATGAAGPTIGAAAIGPGVPPAGANLSALHPPHTCAASGFSYAELERSPQGPFGVITSGSNPSL